MALIDENSYIEQILRRKKNGERVTLGMIAEDIKNYKFDAEYIWRGFIKAGIIPPIPEELKEDDYLASLYN